MGLISPFKPEAWGLWICLTKNLVSQLTLEFKSVCSEYGAQTH
jgi:hypothetical protein